MSHTRREKSSPWDGMDVRPTFMLSNQLVSGGTGSLDGPLTIKPPSPEISGQRGIEIVFETSPLAGAAGALNGLRIPRASPVDVSGRLVPPLAHATLTLKYLGPNDTGLHELARLLTDSRGRFALSNWRPPIAGRYELWPFVTPPTGDTAHASDYACPRGLEVIASDAPTIVPGKRAVAVLASAPRWSGRTVFVGLRCPLTELPSWCRGGLALRVLNVRARRPYRITAGRSGLLEIRLPKGRALGSAAAARLVIERRGAPRLHRTLHRE